MATTTDPKQVNLQTAWDARGDGWLIESTGANYGYKPVVSHVACEAAWSLGVDEDALSGGITFDIYEGGEGNLRVAATCDDCGHAIEFAWNLV